MAGAEAAAEADGGGEAAAEAGGEAAAETAGADEVIRGPITVTKAQTPTLRCYLQGRGPTGKRCFIVGVTAKQYPTNFEAVAQVLKALILERGLTKAQVLSMVRDRHPDLMR